MKKTVSLEAIASWLEDQIKAADNSLYDSGDISQTHSFIIFHNSGDYLKYKKEKYLNPEQEPTNQEVIICIYDDGGIQDSTIPIDTYLEMIQVEFFAREEMRSDMEALFYAISLTLKSYLDTIGGMAVQVVSNSQPVFNPKKTFGFDCFDGYLDLNFIVYEGAKISNTYTLKINDISVPFISLNMGRGFETTPDLRKRDSTLYFQNTSAFKIEIKSLYTNNSAINSLFSDMTSASNFGTKYNITINDASGMAILGMDMYAGAINFQFAYGSIISWNASFLPAISV